MQNLLKKYRVIFLGLLVLVIRSEAGEGISGFEFLRTDFSPRSCAMAGGFLALRGDVNGVLQNPAIMAYTEDQQFCFNYSNYLLDIKGGQAAYTQRWNGHGQVSATILYFNYGSFDETDEFATPTGRTFTANDFAMAVSYADDLESQFTYGVTLKYLHSKIDTYTSSAFGLDLGMVYEAPFSKDLFFGIALLNVGKTVSAYVTTRENLPLSIKFGFSKKLAHLPLVYNFSFNDLNVEENSIIDRFAKFSLGGEFTLSRIFRLRLGYDNQQHQDLETPGTKFSGVSLGFGLFWSTYRFDYAFSSFGDLGTAHRIGIQGSL
jgi:hypothetical protein